MMLSNMNLIFEDENEQYESEAEDNYDATMMLINMDLK